MQKRLAIGARLKELRKQNKFSQQFVAENLFISQAAYSLIENSQNGIVAEHIVNLSKLYEVTTDFILKGDNMLIRISPTQGFIPYVQQKAHAGYVQNSVEEIASQHESEWYRIPGYNPAVDHMLFEIEGKSMLPTVLPGDIVICQKQKNWDNILDGSLVIVWTTNSLLIKRIRSGDDKDYLKFENDNLDDAEIITFPRNDIKEILMVRGKISNVLVPTLQMSSDGKIKSMEESIEFLKKELYLITKKLNSLRN
ncbi:MAG: LexA family transcriptional regulator [Gillisia sp.]